MDKQDIKRNLKLTILIIFGSLSWSLTMIKSGLVYSFGMGFWGPNAHDGVWHIALANSLARGTWEMPVFSGEIIKNYHIGFDLLLAFLHKITFIPINTLYFQILPPIFALTIGILVYKFVLKWKFSFKQAFWATFFVYFGGSFGYIVSLIREKKIDGESIFWSAQSISSLINPPFALSIVFIFLSLKLLFDALPTKNKKILTTAIFLLGSLVQIKVYAGILVLAALFFSSMWEFFKKRDITLIKVFAASLVLSILLFTPMSKNPEEVIIFKPFWFLETMMIFPDRFYWPRMGEAMVNYKLAGNLIKGIPAYVLAFIIFWFGNLGTRVIKEALIFKWLKNFKKLSFLEVFFITLIFLGILIPLFFVQSGTSWNTIQFLYYSLFFSGVLAGVSLGKYLDDFEEKFKSEKKISFLKKPWIFYLVVILTLPTTIGTLWFHYLPSRPPAKISQDELNALNFLSKQPQGVVLTIPFKRGSPLRKKYDPPLPLYLYETTAYVSAYSNKPIFLEDEINLEITNYNFEKRKNSSLLFFENPNDDFLLKNNINYLYIVKEMGNFNFEKMNLSKIFENSEIIIYKKI